MVPSSLIYGSIVVLPLCSGPKTLRSSVGALYAASATTPYPYTNYDICFSKPSSEGFFFPNLGCYILDLGRPTLHIPSECLGRWPRWRSTHLNNASHAKLAGGVKRNVNVLGLMMRNVYDVPLPIRTAILESRGKLGDLNERQSLSLLHLSIPLQANDRRGLPVKALV